MGRRIFYSAGPRYVVLGFLQCVLFGALLYALCYVRIGYLIAKFLLLAFGAIGTMLRRDRAVADPRFRTLDVTRWWFVVPYKRLSVRFDQIEFVRWEKDELVAGLPAGQRCVLARVSAPDAAMSQEVRQFFGLPPNPEHDLPFVPAPLTSAVKVDDRLAWGIIAVVLLGAIAVGWIALMV